MNGNPILDHLRKRQDRKPLLCSQDGQMQLSRQAVYEHVMRCADQLHRLAVEGVALLLDNGPAQIIADLAAWEAGIWTVQLPPFFSESQRQHAMQQSGCQYFVSDRSVLPATQLGTIEVAGQPLLLGYSNQSPAGQVWPGTVKVTFTSGSTGTPKGLCLGAANLAQPAQAIARLAGPVGVRRHMSVLPLAVLLEQVAGVYAAVLADVEVVVPSLAQSGMAGRELDVSKLYHCLRKNRINSCILVPELLQAIVNYCRATASTLPDLDFIAVGGATVPPGLLEAARAAGLKVFEGYGLSEAGSVTTLNTPASHKAGSCGQELDHQRLLFADDGEICLQKPGFLGYCGDKQLPPSPFPTGDIGQRDEQGFIYISGRKKNVLITSMGRNISPEWVESLLLGNGVIDQALVFGDGQAALSVLVVSDCPDNQIQTCIAACNSKLPEYAQIHDWYRVAPFTVENGMLTANGKLVREQIHRHSESRGNLPATVLSYCS